MKKKILIFIYTLGSGGSERFITSLLNNGLLDMYSVDIILFYPVVSYTLPDEVRIKTIINNDTIKYNVFHKVFLLIYGHFFLIKQLIKGQYDLLLSFGTIPGMIACLATFFVKKTKCIVNIRTQPSLKYFRKNTLDKIYLFFQSLLLNRAHILICNASSIKEDLQKNLKISRPIYTINNILDSQNIKSLSSQTLNEEQELIFRHPTIINVGRLSFPKGQWHLIRAFKKIKESIPDCKLVIIGEGEMEKKLKNLVKELYLNSDVYFLGFQENPFKFMKRSNVFVLSSLWEGFPSVLLEAMACGVPLISTDCSSAVREILDFKKDVYTLREAEVTNRGILVPVPDKSFYGNEVPLTFEENIIADAIIKVITQPVSFSTDIPEKYQSRIVLSEYADAIKHILE